MSHRASSNMHPPFFIFYAFNAELFLVFMPSNSKSPSHFSDIYCSVIKAQGLNLQRNGTPEPLKMIYQKMNPRYLCVAILFLERWLQSFECLQNRNLIWCLLFLCKNQKICFRWSGKHVLSSKKLLYIEYFMKSVRRVPVFNECLLNQCCTSAPVPRGICLEKKTNVFLCFQLLRRRWFGYRKALEIRADMTHGVFIWHFYILVRTVTNKYLTSLQYECH